MWGQGFAVMVRTLLQQYLDIPDGTECHRKTYASTTLSGAAGERRPGPGGRGCKEVIVAGGCPRAAWGVGDLAGGVWLSPGCLRWPWDAEELLYERDFVGVSD